MSGWLGLVPARGGSRRLPHKNLALVGGRTLVRRALDAAVGAGVLDEVVLSSDDDAILAQGAGVPGVVALRRPAELASDTALAVDVVRHALAEADRRRQVRHRGVVLVQATSPFTTPADVAGVVELLERTGAGSAVTVVRADHALHPLKLKLLDAEGRLRPFLEDDAMRPEQELPELWLRNGSVYAARREVIDAGSLLSEDCRAYAMPPERSVDINLPIDLAFAQFLAARAGEPQDEPAGGG